MKQAQEMGGKMQAAQDELKTKRATGAAGGGLVEVEVNGLGEVLAVRIDPSLVEKQDREMIEDLLRPRSTPPSRRPSNCTPRRCKRSPAACRLPGLPTRCRNCGGGDPGGDKP